MGKLNEIQHLVLLYLASGMTIASLFTNQWKVAEAGNDVVSIKRTSGLFQHCVEDICLDSGENDLKTVLIIVGTITCVLCAVIMTIHYLLNKDRPDLVAKIPQVTLFITIIGGGVLLVGCALFAFDKFGEKSYPGYSFVLCAVGAILLPLGGSLGYRA